MPNLNVPKLYPHQQKAVERLDSGYILCGDVGSGKSLTAIAYFLKRYGYNSRSLYIITTAKKRDSLEWMTEVSIFGLEDVVIDSWNNIQKYMKVRKAVFIFDEQKAIGKGLWANSFIRIAKQNEWIMLTATPGDSWIEYAPIFIANGYYANRSDFIRRHVVYRPFRTFPIIDHYINVDELERLRDRILIKMDYSRKAQIEYEIRKVSYDREKARTVVQDRWDIFKNMPIETTSQFCFVLRKVANSDPSRIKRVRDILKEHKKAIIFYSFDYELDILRTLCDEYVVAEWNGHKHEPVPTVDAWVYLVNYTGSAEGWNCIATNTMIFYSLHYSYKVTKQAAGRIDRMNTPFHELHYFFLKSSLSIDNAIFKALSEKKQFNENKYDSQKKQRI